MKDNWFEKKIYDRLSNKSEGLDLDSLWADLDKKRNSKKRSWFIPIGVLGFILLFLFGFMVTRDGAIKPNLETQFENKSNSTIVENPLGKEVIEVQASNEAATITQKTLSNNMLENQTIKDTKDVAAQIEKANNLKQGSLNNQTSASTEKEFRSVSIEKEFATNPIAINNSSLFNQPQASSLGHLSATNENTDQIVDLKSPKHKKVFILGFDLIAPSTNILYYERARGKVNEPVPSPANSNYGNNASSNWFAGVLGNYGIASRTLNSLEASANEIIEKRRNDEKMLDQFGGGIFIGRNLGKNIFIQTGIQYSQYTSESNFQFIDVANSSSTDTVEITTDPAGNILSVLEGQVQITKTSTRQIRYFQKYKRIAIPVLLGLKFGISDKFDFSLAGGAAINLMSFNSGNIQNQISPIYGFETLKEASYNSALSVQGLLQASMHYQLSKNQQLIFGINYARDLQSRVQTSNFTDKFSAVSFQVSWSRDI